MTDDRRPDDSRDDDARLVIGPTTATWNSMPGSFGSCSMFETPPKMNRVIFFTGKPHLRATSEWASSWKSTETNSSRDERKAVSQ